MEDKHPPVAAGKDRSEHTMDMLRPAKPEERALGDAELSKLVLINLKVTQAKKRFRVIRIVRGLALFLGISLPVWALSVVAVDHWNYSQQVVTICRAFSIIVLSLLFTYFVLRQFFAPIDERRIARYIEERHPELKDRLVSVIECSRRESKTVSLNPLFPLLLSDLIKSFQKIEIPPLFGRKKPFLGASLAGVFIFSFAAFQFFGPEFLRYATLNLYMPWAVVRSPALYSIHVKPGNIELPKGSDQLITANLSGFDAFEVILYFKHGSTPGWDSRRMEPGHNSSSFGFLFLDVNKEIRYYVQSGAIKTDEFCISVVEQPRVRQVDVTYHYPAYTGLPTRIEEDASEIAAVKGTKISLALTASTDAPAGKIVLRDGSIFPLSRTGMGRFEAQLQILKDSSFRIQLQDLSHNFVVASNEYFIKALADTPPSVSLLKPGRDRKVTQLEEVSIEVKAQDDFGVRALELHFSVNGGDKNTVPLFGGSSPSPIKPAISSAERSYVTPKQQAHSPLPNSPTSMSGIHTFFLEEYKLEPGDVISYYATASDANSLSTSDIYFLEVRPFGKRYSQEQVSGGVSVDSSGDSDVLSARQKEILAATWRLIRDRKTFVNDEFAGNLKLVAAQQQKLQLQTHTLSERIQRRALTSRDKGIENLSENLIKALGAMSSAWQLLAKEKPAEAVNPEQVSLRYLLKAEAYFKQIQVAYGNMSAGQAKNLGAQELENLFELELDKLKNQYEMQQQSGATSQNQKLDEALQKLKQLAHRQQELIENKRRQFGTHANPSVGDRASGPQTIEQEAETLARQLERLSREMLDDELSRASHQLMQASRDLRPGRFYPPGGDPANRGLQALSRMNEVQQLLDRKLNGSLAQDLKRLRNDAQSLVEREEKIQNALESLTKAAPTKRQPDPSNIRKNKPARQEMKEKQLILQDKSRLAQAASAMEQDLLNIARKASSEQKKLSQRLWTAANSLRDHRLQENIIQGNRLISLDLYELAKQSEQNNLAVMTALKQKLETAEKLMDPSLSNTRKDRLSEALNRADDLAEALESLSRRIRDLHQLQPQSLPTRASSSKIKSNQSGDSATGSQADHPKSAQSSEKIPAMENPQAQQQASSAKNSINSNGDSAASQDPSDGSIKGGFGQSDKLPAHTRDMKKDFIRKQKPRESTAPHEPSDQKTPLDTERQSSGNNTQGTAAVNFGDYQLPTPHHPGNDTYTQLDREFEFRIQEAQNLSRNLSAEDELADQLKNMVERMKQMQDLRFAFNPHKLEHLEGEIIQDLRQFELNLSRNLQMLLLKNNLRFVRDEEVPLPYRHQVEEYFKALSKQ